VTIALDSVTIVTVTYQSAGLVPRLAEVLRPFAQVIAVDNASRDGCADALKKNIPHARLVRNDRNLGFGPANNQGVALVQTPFALLLNPDCEISPEAVQCLLDTAERYPSAAIIAPQGWHNQNTPQPSYRHAFYEQRAPRAYQIPDGTCSARWLHGCCMLVRVDALRGFGGFDERFFLYYEDDDLCLRALQSGYDCLLEPAARVLHPGGISSAPSWRTQFRKHYYFFRSRHLILRKYVGAAAAGRYRLKTALVGPLATLAYGLLFQRRHALKWLAWGCSAWMPAAAHMTTRNQS
jgi:N-acetylglucosaminyl-diphospho-decaprenol L-rhamnosyltransferase